MYSIIVLRNALLKAGMICEEPLIYLNYPGNDIELVSKGETYSTCRHMGTGREFTVFTELLVESAGAVTVMTNYINNFLCLDIGTEVELCKVFGKYALVKHGDSFGWLLTNQI